MKMIVGLGNPGKEYDRTKHNTGFMTLEAFLRRQGYELSRTKFEGRYSKQKLDNQDVLFLEPQTYMNESGRSVGQFAQFYHIAPSDIMIIQDDMDMPIGKLRLRTDGRSGGHNGIKSIISALGTTKFNRLKIGIRHPEGATVVSWVLTPFNAAQQELMDQAFASAGDLLSDFIADKDSQYLMNQYN